MAFWLVTFVVSAIALVLLAERDGRRYLLDEFQRWVEPNPMNDSIIISNPDGLRISRYEHYADGGLRAHASIDVGRLYNSWWL